MRRHARQELLAAADGLGTGVLVAYRLPEPVVAEDAEEAVGDGVKVYDVKGLEI